MDDFYINVVNVEDGFVKEYLYKSGVVWLFNLFYFFYFGGVWECFIGVIRCVFDFMLLEILLGSLMYEIFIMFFVEVLVIVNSCLLVLVLIDFEDFFFLSFLLILIYKLDNIVDYIFIDGKDFLCF